MQTHMCMRTLALSVLAVSAAAEVFFEETFSNSDWEKTWISSEWKGDQMGEWKQTAGDWHVDAEREKGIMTTTDMKFHAISAKTKEFSAKDKTLVVQFSVKNEKRQYSFCGGGYIKLLPSVSMEDQKKFGGDTDYYIMFGPDMCAYDVSRIHMIFNHKGKNMLKNDEIKLEYSDKNEFTHLYTLVLHPDGKYEVYMDLKEKAKGEIVDGWDFPKKSKDDPDDKKPSDWVDTKQIADPEEKKPEGFDDIPKQIRDPEAKKPEDWDDDSDGEWEAPMIDNPEFKGEWKPKMIDNPAYKGEWKPKQIDNADYAPETYAKYENIGGVGFELWTVNNGSIFDNILICDSYDYAKEQAEKTWKLTFDKEKDAKEAWEKANKKDDEKKDDKKDDDDDDDEKKDDKKDDKKEL